MFAGAVVCEVMRLPIRLGCHSPRFEQNVWDLTVVDGIPRFFSPSRRTLDFTKIRNPRWWTVAKEYLLALMAPEHEQVHVLADAYRLPKTLITCQQRLEWLTSWMNWITEQGITGLGEVTQEHCDRYLQHRSTIYDRDGSVLRDASDDTRMMAELVPRELAYYSELFSTDRYRDGFCPRTTTVVRVGGNTENKTQPARPELQQPLLAAALFLVQKVGPHVIALQPEAEGRRAAPRVAAMPLAAREEALARTLREHARTGEPLVQTSPEGLEYKIGKGWDPADSLFHVSLKSLVRESGTGGSDPRRPWVESGGRWASILPLLEQTLAQVGVAPPLGRHAALIDRADGDGQVPWTLPLFAADVRALVGVVRTACMIAISALSGMRHSELCELPEDCQRPPEQFGPGRVRHRLKSKLIKGQKLGGVWDEWVVVAEAYEAAGVARHLAGPDAAHLFPQTLNFGGRDGRYARFREWVNGEEGARLGLAPIPPDPLSLRVLRRTLAVEIAHRPGGLLAAKIQLKHLSVVTTEGYANRPGGAQAKFLAEAGEAEHNRNLTLTLQAFRDFQAGHQPAGPGARDLMSFFKSVENELTLQNLGAPQIKHSDQEVINLLSQRAGTLHLGIANYCWFIDPDKALCLKLAQAKDRGRPLAGMCDSARCPQATHHPCHRPVWASAAANSRVFIGKIGRSQKAEKARLTAEAERAETVVAAIDAALAPATGGVHGQDQ
ncbi:site-specific integrase [Streptomyces mirabilis]|uniref:site-specific integrase n=1 Tax=Streptomyces mirabilis TaxID=68239 RepID=UPI0022511850|nr:site-specific integrase [Streptomyces mirabilis]MCX5356280.1 site-specific integrase [Streptomyces mirabilis]